MLNQILLRNGFMGDLLEVGKLKDISEDFDLKSIVVRSDYKIQLRFADFKEAHAAYYALQRANLPSDTHQLSSALDHGTLNEMEDQTELDKRYQKRLQEIMEDRGDSGQQEKLVVMPEKLQVTFQNPEPNYYDGMFATQFENCIRDKFEGLDEINEVPSDYVVRGLKEHDIASCRVPPGL